ncbi:ABC transporter permease subunit [Loigolactobacillus iwatensis]|uniref:ABC transporter permease subunit n=1 Tax=Loigolactobacillus iwatensis TaxID=1267156 RepID=UPI00384C9026
MMSMQTLTATEHAPVKKVHFTGRKLLPWLVPGLLIIGWQVASMLNVLPASILPSPVDVLKQGVKLWQTGDLQTNLSISLYRASIGFLIGGSLGFGLALLTALSKTARALLDSSIQMLRNIPHLSLIPLIIIWFGIGETAKISLVAIGVLFPIYINTYQGLTTGDKSLLEMGRSYGLSKTKLFTRIIFPGALPSILNGVRYALGVMWTTLIVAETIASSSGIGYMSTNAQDFLDMKTILLCIAIYALLGKLSDLMAKWLEGILLDWQQKG